MSNDPKTSQEEKLVAHLRAMNEALTNRVEELEATVEQRDEKIRDLECELSAARLLSPGVE